MKLEILAHGTSLPLQLTISDSIDAQLRTTLEEELSVCDRENSAVTFLCGAGGSTEKIAREIMESLGASYAKTTDIFKIENGSSREIQELDEFCARKSIGRVVAVGGGKVIDVAKSLKARRAIKLTVLPTTLSSDCIASPVVVIRDIDGVVRSRPGGMPDSIFIDTTVTRRAPLRLTLSGLGDIISNASAAMDYEEKQIASSHTRTGFARILSESAYRMVIGLDKGSLSTHNAHRRIAEGLVLSGLAMAFAGDSSPCSGGEHLISHALDSTGEVESTHGLQVSVSTAFCLALRRLSGVCRDIDTLIEFMKNVGLPMRPEDIGVSRKTFKQAVRNSPNTRPGRVTIMSRDWSDAEIDSALKIVDTWCD